MDELRLKLSTKFMKGIFAKLIARGIRKKYDCKAEVQINELEITTINEQTYIHLNVDGNLNSEEFKKLIKSIGLD